jgi:hypothetical protein
MLISQYQHPCGLVEVLARKGNTPNQKQSIMTTNYVIYCKSTNQYLVAVKDDLFTTRHWADQYIRAEMHETIPAAHAAVKSLDLLPGDNRDNYIVLGVQLVEVISPEDLATRKKQAQILVNQLDVLMAGANYSINIHCADDGVITAQNAFTKTEIDYPEETWRRLIECKGLKDEFEGIWSVLQQQEYSEEY